MLHSSKSLCVQPFPCVINPATFSAMLAKTITQKVLFKCQLSGGADLEIWSGCLEQCVNLQSSYQGETQASKSQVKVCFIIQAMVHSSFV